MKRFAVVGALAGLLILAGVGAAAEPTLHTAQGIIEKASSTSVTIQPQGTGGRFAKGMTLRITGTSNLSTLSTRMQGRRAIATQRSARAADLEKNQRIAVIYTDGREGPVLLSAVVLAGSSR